MLVKNGAYRATVALPAWRPGRIEVWVGFVTIGQSAALKTRFGNNGERLTGPNVVDKKILKQVEIKQVLRLP